MEPDEGAPHAKTTRKRNRRRKGRNASSPVEQFRERMQELMEKYPELAKDPKAKNLLDNTVQWLVEVSGSTPPNARIFSVEATSLAHLSSVLTNIGDSAALNTLEILVEGIEVAHTLRAETTELQQRLEDLDQLVKKRDGLLAAPEVLVEKVVEQRDAIRTLARALREAREKNKQVDELVHKIKNLKKRLSRSQQEAKEAVIKYDEAKQKNNRLEEMLMRLEQRTMALEEAKQEMIKSFEEAKQDQQEKIKSLEEAKQDQQEKIKSLEEAKQDQQEAIQRLRQDLDEIRVPLVLRKAMTVLEHWLAIRLVGKPNSRESFPQGLSSIRGLLDSEHKDELLRQLSEEECTLLNYLKANGNEIAHPPVDPDETWRALSSLRPSDQAMGARLLQLLGQLCGEGNQPFGHDPLRFHASPCPGLYLDC